VRPCWAHKKKRAENSARYQSDLTGRSQSPPRCGGSRPTRKHSRKGPHRLLTKWLASVSRGQAKPGLRHNLLISAAFPSIPTPHALSLRGGLASREGFVSKLSHSRPWLT
jgi:hypothetical protein